MYRYASKNSTPCQNMTDLTQEAFDYNTKQKEVKIDAGQNMTSI